MIKVQFFENVFQEKGKTISFDEFLQGIQSGRWIDFVSDVRNSKDKDEKTKNKKKLPCITASCYYRDDSKSKKEGFVENGLICIDLDDVDDVDALFKKLKSDPYVYACHKSVSGNGIACYLKVESNKFSDAFLSLQEYFFMQYGVPIDESCKNINRLRYVSYDPAVYMNAGSELWNKYIKETKKKQIPSKLKTPYVTDGSINEGIVRRLIDSKKVIATSYHEWLRVCFAIVDGFGESGRQYFHELSENNCTGYSNARVVDKQFDYCLKSKKSGVTFATLVYLAKEAGIPVYDERQKKIVQTAALSKKNRVSQKSVIDQLAQIDNISGADVENIINEIYQTDENFLHGATEDDSTIGKIKTYLRQSFNLRFNIMTSQIEFEDGVTMDDKKFNDILIDLKEYVDEDIKDQDLKMIITSSFVEDYDPFRAFLLENQHIERQTEYINKLARCVEVTDEQKIYWPALLKKWLVSGVRMWLGIEQSPLCLVLQSYEMGTGKTHFFRHLLPDSLRCYYDEHPFNFDKNDDKIKLAKNLILMDDEFEGRTRNDEKHFKRNADIREINMRLPYGKFERTFKRKALLCGTANANDILSDPFGNRRIIPIAVRSIDWDSYNKLCKKALWMSVYELALTDFDHKILKEDIRVLNEITMSFKATDPVEELLYMHFSPVRKANFYDRKTLTTTEILDILQIKSTFRSLSGKRLAQLLAASEFQTARRKTGEKIKKYVVWQKDPNMPDAIEEVKSENEINWEI